MDYNEAPKLPTKLFKLCGEKPKKEALRHDLTVQPCGALQRLTRCRRVICPQEWQWLHSRRWCAVESAGGALEDAWQPVHAAPAGLHGVATVA